jgi:hypothetical protein
MTSAFLSTLHFEDNDGLPFVLDAPLIYESALLGRRVTVPAGFKTDLASIPRVLQNLLPKVGKYDRPAVVHDFLYQFNGVTRGQADAVLNEAMTVLGVGRWPRWPIYAGVRAGGWKPWGAYRAKDQAPV